MAGHRLALWVCISIAKVVADLWSNESVQNIKLLGGMAPTVSVEQLAYAARLMNTASKEGQATSRFLAQQAGKAVAWSPLGAGG